MLLLIFTHAPCGSMGQQTDFFFSFFSSFFFTPPTFCFSLKFGMVVNCTKYLFCRYAEFVYELKQECILSAGPTVYSTLTPPPPSFTPPSTHGQVVFASKSWRCEGKGKGGEKVHLKTHSTTSRDCG